MRRSTRRNRTDSRSPGPAACGATHPTAARSSGWSRAARAAESGEAELVVCLIPARTDTRYWHEYATKAEVEFLKGRLRFGGGNSAPFPSALLVFRNANLRYETALNAPEPATGREAIGRGHSEAEGEEADVRAYFKRLWSRLCATFLGLVCDRCGRRGASLVIDAERTSREELDGGRMVVREFKVKSCRCLCPRCR